MSQTLYKYCCLDSTVTREIRDVLHKNLAGRQFANYKFNLSLTEPLLYMELHGMAYDKPKAMARHAALTVQANRMQFALNAIAGLKTPTTHAEWFAVLVQQFCFVRAAASVTSLADVLPNCKITNLAEAQRAVAILHKPILSRADQGELSALTKTGLNVDSPKQLCTFLYRDLALPIQYKKVAGRLTDKETTDILALLTLFKKTEDLTLKLIIQLRGVRTRLENLDVKLNPDGRIRCGYNQLAQDTKGDETGSGGVTSTGRLSCSESPTGSGFNLQTVTKKDRDVFPADPGYWFAQLDLAGADGWTVAAHCKACGDPTMMDDYLNGLKPAKIIALLYERGSSILRLPRHELKTLCACVDQDGWLYFASKRVQHGCLTAGHEVLTHVGWCPIEQLSKGTPIVSWTAPGFFQWDVPTEVINYDYTGHLFHFVGSSYDLEVTHDHRMPLYTNNILRVEEAATVAQRKAADLPLSGAWLGKRQEPLARLAACIMSDGCYTERGHLTFHFKKERKIDRLITLLDTHNIHYTASHNTDNTVTISCAINPPRLPKLLGPWVLAWDDHSMAEFVDEYTYWDGHHGKTSRTVFSVNKPHLMWLATMTRLSRSGYSYQGVFTSGFGSQVHRLNLNQRTKAALESMQVTSKEVTDVPVYCVKVLSGFFLVRKGDKIMVTGNSNYGMKGQTMSAQILKDSYKLFGVPISVEPHTCDQLQTYYFMRYPGILQWHDRIKRALKDDGFIISASGHKRIFFGRRNDHDTFKQACAEEPQNNTTYATNLAMSRLWDDPENRVQNAGRTRLRIQPLHTVHDALNVQFPKADLTWALTSLRSYFNNPIQIAGQTIIIPFEGAYGPSWGELGEKYGGGKI